MSYDPDDVFDDRDMIDDVECQVCGESHVLYNGLKYYNDHIWELADDTYVCRDNHDDMCLTIWLNREFMKELQKSGFVIPRDLSNRTSVLKTLKKCDRAVASSIREGLISDYTIDTDMVNGIIDAVEFDDLETAVEAIRAAEIHTGIYLKEEKE